ncbi:MAG: HAMP domain-containing sensor histidine kinase, partial [Myxococcales bacterium]
AETRPRATVAEMDALFEAVEMLRQRSAELEAFEHAARRATEDAERMRVTFVASMGHDLRGPLNSILGFADLLAMEGVDEVAESQKQSVSIIRRSAQDLLVLLDQILDWARLQAGRIELSPEPTALLPVLQEVAREAEQRSSDRGLTVRVTNLGPIAPVAADPRRLRQALLGLMDHATRVANGPQVSVVVRCEEASVEVDVHDPLLEIREADQQSFFEAFRPSYRPGGERIAGLGLGPALARALIRAHGGDVWFDSRREQGTTFHLRLPLADD